jgi:hypothetical protein
MATNEERDIKAEERKQDIKRELKSKMGCGDNEDKLHNDYDFLNKED